MIIRDLIEKSLEMFSKEPYNYYLFYRTYELAKQQLLMKEKYVINTGREQERIKAFQDFYFNRLRDAIVNTKKEPNESNRDYNLRVKKVYFDLRKKSFLSLQEFVREDYGVIYKVLKDPNPTIEKSRTSLAGDKIIAIRQGDYN